MREHFILDGYWNFHFNKFLQIINAVKLVVQSASVFEIGICIMVDSNYKFIK